MEISAQKLQRRQRRGLRGRLALLGLLLLMQGCGREGGDAGPALEPATGTVRLLLGAEPSSLNPLQATDEYAAFILRHVAEGLLGYDADNRLAPALAERWEMEANVVRFHLRRDLVWEDGSALDARDFVYAWRELLQPENAAPYASLLFLLENARAIARGEMPVESLGVSAPDPWLLEARCSEPCGHFAALSAHMSLLPLPRAFHAAHREHYGADAGMLLANGPFRLVRWVHGAEILLEKNPRYRDAAAIRLSRIQIPYMTTDTQAQLNLLLDGRVALVNVSGESLPRVLPERLGLRQFSTGYIEFLGFNFRPGRLTANRSLRRAIRAAIDADELVNSIVRLPGARVTDSMYPSVLGGLNGRFIDEYPLRGAARGEVEARTLLEQARAELASEPLPVLYLLVSDEPVSVKLAEYLQARLAAVLGLELRIDRQSFKQRLQKMNEGEYDLVLANWSPDFDDPITFGELFASWSPFNRGRYASAEYDAAVRQAQQQLDRASRMRSMSRLQELVLRDVPILPLYENSRIYVQHPGLQGVVRSPFGGDPDLRHAWIEAR